MLSATLFCPLPPSGALRGGQNLNCKFKTFGFLDDLDTLKVTYSPVTLQVLLYLSFKQNSRKKHQTNFFYILHSTIIDIL